ncbi:MAG: hypothetical protein GTO46_15060, partial [Gemmatimonadetes bacterium]|nr:hypothetical protein [Gemmatimonadota bacterium]
LAVLPLENLSGDPEQEYFADGMTEALITDLAKIGALKVISRTSVMHYKEARRPLPEIADELDVDGLITGAVLRAGDRVRITAQLVEPETEEHLWADRYDRDLRDILALQAEVVEAIAREIQIVLTPHEEARLTTARTVDPKAHEAFLRGYYQLHKRTAEGLKQAIDHFQQALEADPSYARAHAALAMTYIMLGNWGALPPEEVFPRAKAAAERALELDDLLAESHNALGSVY